jgi:TetR/AcrR family transcriptional repressor of nem operon
MVFMKKSAETRRIMLENAFELIYVKGYQATSIDEIIAKVQVTKGAFFYHFKNKEEMGLAVIQELMYKAMQEFFVQPLHDAQDPVMDIYAMIKKLLFNTPQLKVEYGCPVGNLTQEMAPLNNDFSNALAAVTSVWQEALINCITVGKQSGVIRAMVNAEQVACFVMSGYWGVRNLGKLYKSTDCYVFYLKELKAYLRTLEN